MLESVSAEAFVSDVDPLQQAFSSLLELRADKFDPVRFQLIESLFRRRAALNSAARVKLNQRLKLLLQGYLQAYETARINAENVLQVISQNYPDQLIKAENYLENGEFSNLKRLLIKLDIKATSSLTLVPATVSEGDAASSNTDGTPLVASQRVQDELKSMRLFRESWAKFNTEKRVNKTIDGLSEDVGPLNSARLIIQAMSKMRAISPEYLNRFLAYADSLLWLDAASTKLEVIPEKQIAKRNRPKR